VIAAAARLRLQLLDTARRFCLGETFVERRLPSPSLCCSMSPLPALIAMSELGAEGQG
jgi:hypothetical protein